MLNLYLLIVLYFPLSKEKRLYWCNWKVEQPQDKGIYLKDILEDNVDNKYYLSDSMINYITSTGTKKL